MSTEEQEWRRDADLGFAIYTDGGGYEWRVPVELMEQRQPNALQGRTDAVQGEPPCEHPQLRWLEDVHEYGSRQATDWQWCPDCGALRNTSTGRWELVRG